MTSSEWTPREIYRYTLSWQSEGIAVTLHSDLWDKGNEWCKKTLNPLHYMARKYTGIYQDTFYFQNQKAANGFKAQFSDYTDLNEIVPNFEKLVVDDNGQFKR